MSKIKVNEIEAATGSTVSIPTGQTFSVADGIPATNLSGTIADARLPTVPVTKGGTGLTSLGSAGQAIKVNSGGNALEFGTVSGGLNLIKTTAISSAVSYVDFNNTYVNSTYNNYKMIIRGLSTSADNQDVYIKFSTDNGSNFATMVGCRINTQINAGSQSFGGTGNLAGGFPLGSDEEGDDTKQVNAEMTFYDLNSNNTYKFGTGMATVVNQNGDLYSYVVSGYSSSTSAVNFIRVYTLAGGNLDDGSISLYGFSE